MTSDNLNYQKAIESSSIYGTNPKGFVDEGIPGLNTADKIMISQNNTIIALLVMIHEKLDTRSGRTIINQKEVQKDLDKIQELIKRLPLDKKTSTSEPKIFGAHK